MLSHIVTAVPADDLFTTASNITSKFVNTALALGGAVIAWFLVKNLAKATTIMSAVIAIVSAIALWWLLTQSSNPAIKKQFDDTVNKNLGISQIQPAPTGGWAGSGPGGGA